MLSCTFLLLLPIPAEPANLQLSFTVAAANQVYVAAATFRFPLGSSCRRRARTAQILKKESKKETSFLKKNQKERNHFSKIKKIKK
ncbi:hypothetical protein [Methanimicrococcus hongohii]|uniref:hypothetical protein n=1 Tax=Methanimicrococcus hongohii TaxID=3028295 RepID=UPI00292E4EC0|nr:hypothetical protein [Methanimicrococcus sp. Hf6]